MKWTVSINQRAAVEMQLNVDMIDLAIFDMLKDFTPCAACRKMQDSERQYFSVPYKKVIDELPLLPIKTPDGIYRRFKKLEQAGLIEMHPENAKMAMVWFAWGRNFQALSFGKTPGYKSEGTPRFISVPPRMKIRTPPDENPTYNIGNPIPSYTGTRTGSETTTAAEKNPIPLEAEKNTPPPPVPARPPAPLALSGFVDAAAEVERLRTDERARETFVRNRRIPQELYERYLQEFATEVTATQEPHYGVASFRRHFFNWAEKHYRIAKERAAQPAPGRSSIPAGIKTFGA